MKQRMPTAQQVVTNNPSLRAPAVYRPHPVPKVLQRKVAPGLQSGVNNSTRPLSPPAHQLMRNLHGRTAFQAAQRTGSRAGLNVVQRNIDSTHFEKSDDANPLYMVNPNARRTLYSRIGAPPPKPTGLYSKKSERDDASERQVYAWTPNVRFLSNLEKNVDRQWMYETGAGKQKLDARALMTGVENPVDPTAEELPTFGIVGKNDCTGFGRTLFNCIAREHNRGEVVADPMSANFYEQDYPALEVGDMMRHMFATSSCGWHGATVVAQDRNRHVTLEGDVSKDRSAPEFYIHAGVAGFVASNIHGTLETSTKVEVRKYVGGTPEDNDLRRYGLVASGQHDVLLGDTSTTKYTPLTGTEQGAFNRLGFLLKNKKWDTQGWGLFVNHLPDGIRRMRLAFDQGNYWEVFRIADEKDKNNDSNRTALVRDLYAYLSSIWDQLKKVPRQQYVPLLVQLMRELSTWDISGR